MISTMLAVAIAVAPATAASDLRIDIGTVDWASYPALSLRDEALPMGAMLERMEEILRDRQCAFRGQSRRRFDVDVPWVIQVEPDGRIARLVVADTGCRPLELFVAEVVLSLTRAGEIQPPASPETGYYRSTFNFNQETVRW